MSITWHVQDFKTLLFGENYINNKKNKNSNNTDDAFCLVHEYKQWPKSLFETRFKKKKWRLDILPQYLANLTLPVEN